MFKKSILTVFPVFLLLNLNQIYDNLMPLDLSGVNVTGLVVGVLTIVIVGAGFVIFFRKRSVLSKTFSAVLIIGLLVLALSGTAVAALRFEDSNTMSHFELETIVLGATGYSVFQLADGGFILNSANESHSFLVKLDSSYHEIWTKTFRIGQEDTVLDRLIPTNDGGFALAGIVKNQYVLMKTDLQGNIEWTATYNSGDPISFLRAMIQTRDGGFALAGFGEAEEEGLGWIWFAKTDAEGKMLWNKTFSGPVADCPSALIETSDGEYMMSDVSYSYVPDQGFFRLIKMDTNGNVLWNTTYGGEGRYLEPECNFAIATKDRGYLMGGYLWDTDAWVVKTDKQGNMQWNQTYGEKGSSITNALEIPSGGYLLGSISHFHTAGIITIDSAGNKLWNITFPNVTWTIGYESNYNSIIQAENGNYIMIGSKNQSVWLAKLNYQNNLPASLQALLIINASLALAAVMTLSIALKKKETHSTINLPRVR